MADRDLTENEFSDVVWLDEYVLCPRCGTDEVCIIGPYTGDNPTAKIAKMFAIRFACRLCDGEDIQPVTADDGDLDNLKGFDVAILQTDDRRVRWVVIPSWFLYRE